MIEFDFDNMVKNFVQKEIMDGLMVYTIIILGSHFSLKIAILLVNFSTVEKSTNSRPAFRTARQLGFLYKAVSFCHRFVRLFL